MLLLINKREFDLYEFKNVYIVLFKTTRQKYYSTSKTLTKSNIAPCSLIYTVSITSNTTPYPSAHLRVYLY